MNKQCLLFKNNRELHRDIRGSSCDTVNVIWFLQFVQERKRLCVCERERAEVRLVSLHSVQKVIHWLIRKQKKCVIIHRTYKNVCVYLCNMCVDIGICIQIHVDSSACEYGKSISTLYFVCLPQLLNK